MKKILLAITFIAALNAVATSVSAQKVKDTAVTAAIEDANQNYVPFRIQSDLLGSYKNGTNSVVSRIQSIGDWELSLLDSATRRVYIDFGDPVAGNDPNKPAPFAGAYVPVRFLAQCPADLRNLAAGDSQLCKMIVAVDYQTQRYSIRFGCHAGTTQPKWTCSSAASGKCGSWRLSSETDGTGKLAAQLIKITTVRNKNVEELVGKYYFSFAIAVSNP